MVNRQVGKPRAEREERDRGVFRPFEPRSASQMKARAQNRGGGYDSLLKQGTDEFRTKQGENTIRILRPTWNGHDNFGYSVYVHFNIGPEQKASYLCLERNVKPGTKKPMSDKCPICDLQRQLSRAGDTQEAGQIRPVERVLCWVLDRNGDERKPLAYFMPQSVDSEINERCTDSNSGKVVCPDDPDKGRDITIKKRGEGLHTKYIISVDMDESAVAEDKKTYNKLEAFIWENPVPELLNFYSVQHLKKVVSGTAVEKDEDLDEDSSDDHDHEEEEARSSMKAKRRPAEDDDEDEDDKPVARKARRSNGEDAEDEEDDDDKTVRKARRRADDDEDEDERPQRAKRKADDDEDEEPEDERPQRAKRRRDDDDESDEDPVPSRAKRRDDDDEDDAPPRERVRPRR